MSETTPPAQPESPLPLSLVCEMARSIPCSPWLLPPLMDLLSKPEKAEAHDVQAMIMKDPGLSTAVLRMANSAFFASSMQCETVADAVVRIGFKQLYRIAAGSLAGRWLANQPVGAYGWEPGDLYKHSLCVAVASEALAKRVGHGVQTELAYTAGLLHDVGKLALAHACADQFEKIRLHQLEKGVPWRQAEHDLLGYDHTDVGGVLTEGWGYPVSLVEVACYYPRPRMAGSEQQPLVTLVHAGKHLATSMGYGVGEDGFSVELDEELLQRFGVTEELLEKVLPEIVTGTEKLLQAGVPG